jgi:hypothetical protein
MSLAVNLKQLARTLSVLGAHDAVNVCNEASDHIIALESRLRAAERDRRDAQRSEAASSDRARALAAELEEARATIRGLAADTE